MPMPVAAVCLQRNSLAWDTVSPVCLLSFRNTPATVGVQLVQPMQSCGQLQVQIWVTRLLSNPGAKLIDCVFLLLQVKDLQW